MSEAAPRAKAPPRTLGNLIRCPQFVICTVFCPCLFCFHPDEVLKREELIRHMMEQGKGKNVNLDLIDEQLREDRERRIQAKAYWRRRWAVCCCCFCLALIAGPTALILYFALGSWTAICFGAAGSQCGFEARADFGAVYTPDGRVIVVAGRDGTRNFADVWAGSASSGGFERLVAAAPFGARHGHAVLCHVAVGGRLFVLGGDAAGVNGQVPRPLRDVWMSERGDKWTLQTASAPWVGRKYMGAAVDGAGHLFVVGGFDDVGAGGLNDVWLSSDQGKTWSIISWAAPWSGRYSHGLVVLPSGSTAPGLMYVLGGNNGIRLNDVWSSSDGGRTWQIVTFTHTKEMRYTVREDQASWLPRQSMACAVGNDGKLTLTGGETDGGGEDRLSKEVWQLPPPPTTQIAWYEKKSSDNRLNLAFPPLEWSQESTPTWGARRGHQSFVDGAGVVYVVGGEVANGEFRADIWKMEKSVNLNNLRNVY